MVSVCVCSHQCSSPVYTSASFLLFFFPSCASFKCLEQNQTFSLLPGRFQCSTDQSDAAVAPTASVDHQQDLLPSALLDQSQQGRRPSPISVFQHLKSKNTFFFSHKTCEFLEFLCFPLRNGTASAAAASWLSFHGMFCGAEIFSVQKKKLVKDERGSAEQQQTPPSNVAKKKSRCSTFTGLFHFIFSLNVFFSLHVTR